jgi:NAD(P)-dependent dehydrogenase (short-subunit alcohol dehydrogenase family)
MNQVSNNNQSDAQDPRTQYPGPDFDTPMQPEPGLTQNMNPKPDHGETSYQGNGKLKGRKALVTGADSGIGRATAIAFAREGADIMMNYLPEEQVDAQEVIDLIEAAGRKVFTCSGDISHEDFCRKLVDETIEKLGGLDILANIAGKQVTQPGIADITTEQFDQTFRTNVYGMFWLCKFSLPHMGEGSSIINTASIQSYQPSPALLDYASTKAAIVGFTKALAKEAIGHGVRVNAVAPGPIWTPLQPSQGQPPEKVAHFGAETPYGRPGQPAEVAPAYVFFASQDSSYITAEVLGVTGGNHLP